MSKELYTVIYAFMGQKLGLSGVSKEVFAFIFGLWLRKRAPVPAPIQTLVNLTSAARSSVQLAISNLQSQGYIKGKKNPGKRTMYTVSLPESDMAEILLLIGRTPISESGRCPPEDRTATDPKNGKEKEDKLKNKNIPNIAEISKGELEEI